METQLSHSPASAILKEVADDVHSGATEIARKAARCVMAYSEDPHESTTAYRIGLIDLGKKLVAAQPSMASVFNLVNTVLLAVEAVPAQAGFEPLQRATRDAAAQFMRSAEAALDAIALHGEGLITSACTIFTHSSSSTVVGILRQAIRQGKEIQAIATESRPFCEGREMARSLGQQGIQTKLILDAAIGQYVKDADLVLLGVDRISEDAFVNKAGTLPVILAARHAQVPVYLACETSKFLPGAYAPKEEVRRNAEESDHEEWQNVELVYSIFEETPNTLLTGVITEEGILSMNALTKRFKAYRVCPALLK